jgi:hypothetical protein
MALDSAYLAAIEQTGELVVCLFPRPGFLFAAARPWRA